MSPRAFPILAFISAAAALLIVASSPTQAAPQPEMEPVISEKMMEELISILNNMSSEDCFRFVKCGQHGECLLGGLCLCEEGYTGDNCSQTYQPLNQPGGEVVTIGMVRETLAAANIWMASNDIQQIQVNWPTRSGILESEARAECEAIYGKDNSFAKFCNPVMPPNFINAFVDYCVKDVKIVSQLNYVQVSRLRYLTTCVSLIEKIIANLDIENNDRSAL